MAINRQGQATLEEQNTRGFASLKFGDFRLLFLTSPVSSIGQATQRFANAYQVYQLSGSSAQLGLTFLFQALPQILFGFIGGMLADKFDRKKLININQGTQICLAVLLGLLTVFGKIQVWHIYAVTFFASCTRQLEQPARQSIIPSLVPREYILNASTLNLTVGRLSQFFGPMLAGVMVAAMGISSAYFINAALILPAFLVIRMIHLQDSPSRRALKLNMHTVFEGLEFAIASRVLIAFIALDFVVQTTGYFQAMMPVIAKDVLEQGPVGLGLLMSAPSLGSLAGFVMLLLMGNIKRKGLVYIVSILIFCITLFVFSQSTWFVLSLALAAGLGFVDSIGMAIRQTSLQLLAPDEKRGRVMSVNWVISGGADSLGGAYLGFMAFLLGVQTALAMGAIIGGAMALSYLLFWKKVRDFTG
ncbi:MAG: MFS transporter [Dehalococcoidia bacterium]|nr:MFS transporter [Dehalococcoidia bacterium]